MKNYNFNYAFSRAPVHKPEHYCPICGKHAGNEQSSHRCANSTLAAIDAANTKAENYTLVYDGFLAPKYLERLKDGFIMMGLEERADED